MMKECHYCGQTIDASEIDSGHWIDDGISSEPICDPCYTIGLDYTPRDDDGKAHEDYFAPCFEDNGEEED